MLVSSRAAVASPGFANALQCCVSVLGDGALNVEHDMSMRRQVFYLLGMMS